MSDIALIVSNTDTLHLYAKTKRPAEVAPHLVTHIRSVQILNKNVQTVRVIIRQMIINVQFSRIKTENRHPLFPII